MSTNSILTYNQQTLREEYSDKLDYLAKQYMYKRHYMIGDGAKEDEVKHTLLMKRILCTDRCEIINYVADIISGELENCGIKTRNKKLSTLYNCCEKSDNACEFDKCNPRIEF